MIATDSFVTFRDIFASDFSILLVVRLLKLHCIASILEEFRVGTNQKAIGFGLPSHDWNVHPVLVLICGQAMPTATEQNLLNDFRRSPKRAGDGDEVKQRDQARAKLSYNLRKTLD